MNTYKKRDKIELLTQLINHKACTKLIGYSAGLNNLLIQVIAERKLNSYDINVNFVLNMEVFNTMKI